MIVPACYDFKMSIKNRFFYSKFDSLVLGEVIDKLNQFGVVFWIDHGSLLGLRRDGCFLDWDLDVDFGALDISMEEKLTIARSFYDRFGSAFYDVLNDTIKIGLFDRGRNSVWSVDISFYKEDRDCLVKSWVDLEKRDFKSRCFMVLAEMSGGARIRRTNNKWVRRIVNILNFSYSQRVSVYIYKKIRKNIVFVENKVKSNLILPLHDGFYLNSAAPRLVDAYLAFRYGEDWRKPRRDWNYLRDDGGLSR